MTHMSPLRCLPSELIIAIANLLDAPSLVHFKSTCKAFRDVVNQTPCLQYALALAARGLSDGPPSPICVASRLELVEAHEEAWRTFSWSEHLTLDLPYPHAAPCVSGGTVVLPIYGVDRVVRSFVVQSVPSPLRGILGQRWQIDFDFAVERFIIDATQDLLVVVPRHDPKNVLVRALSTGRPHALSANGGILRLEAFRNPSKGHSKHEICGNFLGMITWRSDELDDRLLIWNWKTGVLHVNTPIRVGNLHDAVFSFLDDRHFVVPSLAPPPPSSSARASEIILSVHRLCHQCARQPSPPLVRSYVLSVADVLADVRSLRFFPDVSARGGAASPAGHFYADASRRVFGIQIEATYLSTERATVQELLVPVRALMGTGMMGMDMMSGGGDHRSSSESPRYRRASVCYEPFIGRRIAYASRAGQPHWQQMPVEKLPPALRGVGACRLRFAVCCGALFVFEHADENPKSPRRLHILAF